MSDIGAGLFRSLTVSACAQRGDGTFSALTASAIPAVPTSFLPLTGAASAAEPIAFEALTGGATVVASGGAFLAMSAVGDDNATGTGAGLFAKLTAAGYANDPIAFEELTASGGDRGIGSGSASFMPMTASGVLAARPSFRLITASGSDAGIGKGIAAFSMMSCLGGEGGVGVGAGLFGAMTAIVCERGTIRFAPMSALGYGVNVDDEVTTENPYALDFNGWAMNMESNAPSRYKGFAANSFCQFNGRTYIANAGGIYTYGADDDAGQPIRAAIMLPNTDYGTEVRKRVHDVYVSVKTPDSSSKRLRMRAITDNAPEGYYYPLVPITTKLRSCHVKFGQGLKGRFWQLGMTNIDGSDFELESIMFTPMLLNQRGA